MLRFKIIYNQVEYVYAHSSIYYTISEKYRASVVKWLNLNCSRYGMKRIRIKLNGTLILAFTKQRFDFFGVSSFRHYAKIVLPK